MASVGEITVGLAAQLGALTGLQVTDYVPESVTPPAAFVHVTKVNEDTFGYGSMTVTLEAVFLTSRASARAGQGSLYEYMSHVGNNSVSLLIAANDGLGLTDGTSARVLGYRALGVEEMAAYSYYGGAFEIEVITPT